MHIVTIVALILYARKGSCLMCMQCDRRGGWYSPEENEKAIERCQTGNVTPTRCLNSSATHCILSYYTKGMEPRRIITERRCGTEEDISGCTLYKSSRRMRRHLIGNERSPLKRTSTTFVEVCVDGCPGDNCIPNSARPSFTSLIPFRILALYSLCSFSRWS